MVLNHVGVHPYEIYIVVSTILISIIAAVIPAILAYKINVSKILSKGV